MLKDTKPGPRKASLIALHASLFIEQTSLGLPLKPFLLELVNRVQSFALKKEGPSVEEGHLCLSILVNLGLLTGIKFFIFLYSFSRPRNRF